MAEMEKKPTKTAFQLVACEGGVQVLDTRHTIRAPNGKEIPQIMEWYRLLGQDMDEGVGNIAARDHLVLRARTQIGMIGSIGGIGLKLAARLWDTRVNGLSLTFGGVTPTGRAAAEVIEKTKKRMVAGMGERAWTAPSVQMYLKRDEGGMDLAHAYESTGGATIRHVDKGLRAPPLAPHRVALESQIAWSAWGLGWLPTKEEPTPLDWEPTAGDLAQMKDEFIVEAWWLAREAAGLVTRNTGAGRGTGFHLDPGIALYEQTCDGGGRGCGTRGNS